MHAARVWMCAFSHLIFRFSFHLFPHTLRFVVFVLILICSSYWTIPLTIPYIFLPCSFISASVSDDSLSRQIALCTFLYGYYVFCTCSRLSKIWPENWTFLDNQFFSSLLNSMFIMKNKRFRIHNCDLILIGNGKLWVEKIRSRSNIQVYLNATRHNRARCKRKIICDKSKREQNTCNHF